MQYMACCTFGDSKQEAFHQIYSKKEKKKQTNKIKTSSICLVKNVLGHYI